jgi:hypothetical protein
MVVNLHLPVVSRHINLFTLDGPSVRTSEVVVIVDVLDISEHPPVFLMSNYTAVVYENSAIGTIVLVVGTSDRDTVSQRAPAKKD